MQRRPAPPLDAAAPADVVVVDDDPDAADALADVVAFEGHTVVRTAYDGGEGLCMLRDRTPDLLLLDVDMPVLDGFEVACAMLLEDAGMERVPVVLISGHPELRAIATRIGTPYYLAKPYRLDDLVAMIDRTLRERTPLRRRVCGRVANSVEGALRTTRM